MLFAMTLLVVAIGVTVVMAVLQPSKPVADRYRLLETIMATRNYLSWTTSNGTSMSLKNGHHTSTKGAVPGPFVLTVKHATCVMHTTCSTLADPEEWPTEFGHTLEPEILDNIIDTYEIRHDSVITGSRSLLTDGDYCEDRIWRPIQPNYLAIDNVLRELLAE